MRIEKQQAKRQRPPNVAYAAAASLAAAFALVLTRGIRRDESRSDPLPVETGQLRMDLSTSTSRRVHMQPRRSNLGGRDVLWQFPEMPSGGKDCPVTKGVIFLYHGCTRLASSFFYSPQGRDMMKIALESGMAVVAFAKEEELGCWSRADLQPVMAAGRAWIGEQLVPLCGKDSTESLPFFGFGASSGGSFVAEVAAEASSSNGSSNGGFKLRAINVQIMTPRKQISIPTVFTIMSRDPHTSRGVASVAKDLEEKGVPNKILESKPKQVNTRYFTSRFADDSNMSEEVAKSICDELQSMGAIDPAKDDELVLNPRSLDLDPILRKTPSRPYGVDEGLWKDLNADEREDAANLWLVEELNVAFDQHEITAEGWTDVLNFFLEHAK